MVTKEPRTTSKEIGGEVQGQGISESDHVTHHFWAKVDLMQDDRGGHLIVKEQD